MWPSSFCMLISFVSLLIVLQMMFTCCDRHAQAVVRVLTDTGFAIIESSIFFESIDDSQEHFHTLPHHVGR